MKSKVLGSWLIVVSFLLIFLMGCTAGETSTPEPPIVQNTPPTDVPIQPAEFPVGVFERAQQRITFMEDGTFTVWQTSLETFDVENGRYAINGNQITMQDCTVQDCTDEVCGPDEGLYTWQFEDDKLIFELIEDTCEGRRESLAGTGNKWLYRP